MSSLARWTERWMTASSGRGVGVRAEAALEELGRAGHRHQEVVEVVRHAAGEVADRLHPLGLAQVLLQLDLPGDVLDRALVGGHRAVGSADGAGVVADRDHRAVGAPQAVLQTLHLPLVLDQPPEVRSGEGAGVEAVVEVDLCQLLEGRVAEHADEGRVGHQHPAVDSGPVEADGDVVVEGAESLLALAESLLGAAPLRHLPFQRLGPGGDQLLEVVAMAGELGLGGLAVGDVPGGGDHRPHLAVRRQLRDQEPVDPDAGGELELDAVGLSGCDHPVDRPVPPLDQVGGKAQLGVGLADEIGGGDAGLLLDRGVGVEVSVLAVEAHDDVGGALGQSPEPLCGLGQGDGALADQLLEAVPLLLDRPREATGLLGVGSPLAEHPCDQGDADQ